MGEVALRSSASAPTCNVDWSSRKQVFLTLLTLPTRDDDLATAAKKMRDLQAVVQSGQSLATATHWKWAEDENFLEARWVATNLSSEEFAQYVAWKEGVPPPRVDWDGSPTVSNRWVNNVSKKQLDPSYELIPALEILYPKQVIGAREAYYFAWGQHNARPLVRAILKVRKAGLVFLKEVALWTTVDKGEMLTARRAVASGTLKIGKEPDVLDEHVQSIRTSIRVIQARGYALKWKVLAYEERLKLAGAV